MKSVVALLELSTATVVYGQLVNVLHRQTLKTLKYVQNKTDS